MIDNDTTIEGIELDESHGIELDAGMADLVDTITEFAKAEPVTAGILAEIVKDAIARSSMQSYLASLKPKYLAFLASVVQTGNIGEAAQIAGISRKWASMLMNHRPEAMAAYKEICQIVNEELLQQSILDYIKHTLFPRLVISALIEAQEEARSRVHAQYSVPLSEQIRKMREREKRDEVHKNT